MLCAVKGSYSRKKGIVIESISVFNAKCEICGTPFTTTQELISMCSDCYRALDAIPENRCETTSERGTSLFKRKYGLQVSPKSSKSIRTTSTRGHNLKGTMPFLKGRIERRCD